MKLFLFLLLALFLSATFHAQDKYLIYFTDKGISESEFSQNSGQIFKSLPNILSKKTIERRKKVMGNKFFTFQDLPVSNSYKTAIESLGIKIQNELNWFNAVSAYLTKQQFQKVKLLSFVKSIKKVKTITLSKYLVNNKFLNTRTLSDSNIFNYGPSFEQYQMSEIPVVHTAGINGNGIVIGILDTGFRWKDHPALKNRKVLAEYDFVNHDSITSNQANDSPSQDTHGTLVFSILAGKEEGQIIGPAYDAKFLLAKTEDVTSETKIEEDNFAAALQWMEAKGVDIITSSLGYNQFDSGTSYTYADMNGQTTIVAKAENMAFARGVVTVTAMGNEGENSWHYMISPADAFNVISVGSLNADSSVSAFSSRGPTADGRMKPEIAARGESVYAASLSNKENYRRYSGTSVATPIVAGIAGQLLSFYPFLTNLQVRRIIIESGNNVTSPDNNQGNGLISAVRALNFPNIHKVQGEYILSKTFISKNIDNSNVNIFYKSNNNEFVQKSLSSSDNLLFTFNFPEYLVGDSIQFYFSYSDLNGNMERDPKIKNYKFLYGTTDIYLNSEPEVLSPCSPTENKVFPNYPNPFSNSTTIRYDTKRKSKVTIAIYDILGQKIKDLFKGNSSVGMNFIQWAGDNNSNRKVASGVYIYSVNIDGELLLGKLVYLK